MELAFPYQKKRTEFGRQCLFSDKGPDLIDNYPSNRKLRREYMYKDPVSRSTQLGVTQAEHYLNTISAEFKTTGMNHVEGGWPKDVNCLDEEQTKRYRRKIEKEDNFHHVMMQLFKNMDACILQNNAINIYQQYFKELEPPPMIERNSARTINVYQDQTTPTRPVNHISWSPDNHTKIAVSHCNLVFQAPISKQATSSYIWEVENPNRPLYSLKPEQQTVVLEYNAKDSNILASGQINGQVAVWDMRKGVEPVDISVRENSFLDPVQNILWIHSKSNSEFISSSTDGMVKWWDTRKLSEPTETLILDYVKDKDQTLSRAMGVSVLEYEITIPTRFMMGTEGGMIILGNKKARGAMDKMAMRIPGAHLGPILALQRNPQFLKNFLTVADWSAKIWSEDCRESAIIWTTPYKVTLTGGAWSPTRLSAFFITRADGLLDVWDLLQNQKRPTFGVKVCDEKLTALRTHEGGRIVAVGNQNGTTYLVELSKNLSTCDKTEKLLLTAMLDRENRREKILEARNREIRLKQKANKQPVSTAPEPNSNGTGEAGETTFFDNFVKQAEIDFYQKLESESAKVKTIEETEVMEAKELTDSASQCEKNDSVEKNNQNDNN